jgi:two-component system chemotaxis response regulator CheY
MSQSGPQLSVLVVDDSPIYRKLVAHALDGHEYSVTFAKSGREALEIFAQSAPHIVITDWMMPDVSGIQLCEKIRHSELSYTYVILLTSISDKDMVVKGLEAGADDYLTKPFDPGELIARIGVGRRIICLQRDNEAKNLLLEEAARTDSLTGLPNRRAIEEWADRQIRGASRHRFPLWVVLADLDSFKSVNDNYGHDAGDLVLQKFAELLRSTTRASDICGRMGGEEFVMVLTHVSEEDIGPTVDRLREQFASLIFRFGGQTVSVTSSFGVAGFSGDGCADFSQLLRQADAALYAAKRGGRNRVELAVG